MQIYLPIAELPVSVFLILGMGAAVGFVSGLFGVGGGFLMTPLLIFTGIPHSVAVATVTAQIAASSTSGALSYWRKRALDVPLGLTLISGGLAGTLAGVWFFNRMRNLGQLELTITLSYVTLLGAVGGLMLIESLRAIWRRRTGQASVFKKAARHTWYEKLPFRVRYYRSGIYVSVLPLLAMSLFVGFAGTVLGIGGGFMIVPALIYFFNVPTAVVVGTSLFQILVTMLAAALLHSVTNHQVDVVLALMLVAGGVVGAQLGSRAGEKLKGEKFRLMFALIIFSVAMRFAFEIGIKPAELFSIGSFEIRK